MEITVLGAANEVTGSCYLIETGPARLLVDCGMFQGSERLEKLNHIPWQILSKRLDAVVLTHGHLDHCGRLPLLAREGYSGPVFATAGTIDIARLIMSDAAKIQHDDVDRQNRKRKSAGLKPIEPLYAQKDVDLVCRQFKACDYNRWHQVACGVKIQPVEAGHILGSASIEMIVNQNGGKRRLVFSGDVGPWHAPIMRHPAVIDEAFDLVFCESTYGDRDHRTLAETVSEFEELIKRAVDRKGKILIPTFAVGRTQQILYYLAEMFRKRIIQPIPVYLDSPMAIAATDVYAKYPGLMDEEARSLALSGQLKRDLATLKRCLTADESRALNDIEGPCIILAGAGMCNAGRILHHLRHNLGLPETVVIIVGYQARGSVGREIIEGATRVKIFGETINVRASVKGLGGFSAHAGQSDLIKWLEPMARHRPRIILTHGESQALNEFAYQIHERFSIEATIPKLGEVVVA